VHLLWINLVTDTFPALALGMEHSEPDIMKKKPRDPKAGIFSEGLGLDILYQGIMVAALVLISYFVGHSIADPTLNGDHGITMAFLTMSMAEVFHSLNMRSQRGSLFTLKKQNVVLWLAALGSFVATTLVCEVPFLRDAFELTPVSLKEYGIAIGIGLSVIPIVEIIKLIQRLATKK